MASIFDWSSTASSNTTCDGLNTNTGMTPANVDNVFRSLMSIIRQTFASSLQSFFAGTAGLPVVNGGTGAADATTARTNLGALSDAYRDLVQIAKNSAFTFANSERGGSILYSGAAATATIDPSSTTAINIGAAYVIHNLGTGALTIARGAGVILRANGSTTSANATLALGGIATLTKWGPDYWLITGSGIS